MTPTGSPRAGGSCSACSSPSCATRPWPSRAFGREADGKDDEDGTWTAAMRASRPGTVRLTLAPLPEQAVGSWLGQVRDGVPASEEIRRLAQATGGEPVRIRDQLAATAAAGPRVPSAWLAAAAITADDLVIETALVARMLDLADADADREERNARRLGLIDTSAGVRFTHGSHRDDVIARLETNPALRRSLHRRAFLTLAERVRTDDPDPSLPVRIAEHALGADRDLPAAEAARAFLAAARAERASGEAAAGWARAGIARDPADQGTRASLHLALGDALDQRGADTEADREYELAYDIANGRPLDRAEALIRLARRWTDPGKIDWYLLQRPAQRHRRARGRGPRGRPAAPAPSRSACSSPPTWPASPPWRSRSSAPRRTTSGGRASPRPRRARPGGRPAVDRGL